jgi:hypothetical protein
LAHRSRPEHARKPHAPTSSSSNGAPHLEPSAYAKKFSGKYEHRNITGGIGHNLPPEAPQAFAEAVIDVAKFLKGMLPVRIGPLIRRDR